MCIKRVLIEMYSRNCKQAIEWMRNYYVLYIFLRIIIAQTVEIELNLKDYRHFSLMTIHHN